MSIERVERTGATVWRVRWRDERARNRAKVLGLKRDAETFEAEIKRRKRLGELAVMDAVSTAIGFSPVAAIGSPHWRT